MGSWYYIVDGEFAAFALKIYNFRKDEELVTIIELIISVSL